ncbi:death-associated inhibitor of apoptosis 1-like [Aphis craccivora]|uniref:Death-associated inhibitor of apoptosis 1-like n=1 Tax=Aphis craccivora TaxID=307492 RepID=A0A6G0VYI6_APHCR|nr:death-associated inhibitor of apoptosis 1-like [Aphis craccivora]KAF0711346.1 death-associated inhibitor of apoptosis 1-like [Aphis craccivora]
MNLFKCNVDCQMLMRTVQDKSAPEYLEYSTFLLRLKTFDSHPLRSYQDKYSVARFTGGVMKQGRGGRTGYFILLPSKELRRYLDGRLQTLPGLLQYYLTETCEISRVFCSTAYLI